MSIVLRGTVKIQNTPSSGSGDPSLTRDSSSGEIGVVSAPLSNTLNDGQIFVGNVSNIATGVTPTGDVTMSNSGVFSIESGVIENANVSATAAIAFSKMASLTANRVPVINASGVIVASSVSDTALGYISTLNSNAQTQIDSKQATITGAASTIVSANLATNMVLVSSSLGKVSASATVTEATLDYIANLNADAQTQFDTKLVGNNTSAILQSPSTTEDNYTIVWDDGAGEFTLQSLSAAGVPNGGTTAQILRKASNADQDTEWHTVVFGDLTDVGATTSSEIALLAGLTADAIQLNYTENVTSDIQTQLDAKMSNALAYGAIFVGNAGNVASQLGPGSPNSILTMIGGTPQWQAPPTPGDVSGPGGSTDNAIARWNGTSGTAIQSSSVIIDDSDNVTGVATLSSGQISVLNQAAVRLYETGSTNYVAIRASGAMSSDYTITLPASAPASDTFLKYDGVDYVWAAAAAGGATVFTGLTDVPSSYSGQTLNLVRVNTGETGLEFVTPTTSIIAEGSNLYYTDERAQDAIGTILSASFSYNDTTPSIGLVVGTDGQLPYTNSGGTGHSYSATLVWNNTNTSLLAAGGGATITGSNSHNFGTGSTMDADWSASFVEDGTFNSSANNSFGVGWSHTVGGTGSEGAGSFTMGADNTNLGTNSFIGGLGGKVDNVSDQSGALVMALQGPSVDGLKPSDVPYVLANTGAVNISRNTNAQTPGNGALAQDSGIYSGLNHHIPSNALKSVIIGGNGITVASGVENTVHMPKLRIGLGTSGSISQDDALTKVLMQDGTTGEVKWRDVSTIGSAGAVTSVSGTTNRITSTGGSTPVIDIAATYVGQSSITTVGTLTSGSTGSGFTIALGTSTLTGDLPFSNLTQISGLSVLGVGGTATSDVAGITGTANQILRVNGAGTTLSFGSIDLSQSSSVGSSVLSIANGGTGSSTQNFWGLSGTSTLAGAATVTNNTANGLTFTGTFTASANLQASHRYLGTFTARATISDELYGYEYAPTLVAAATGQILSTMKIGGSYTAGGFSPTQRTLWIKGASGGAPLYIESDAAAQILRVTNTGAFVLGASGNSTTITPGVRTLTFAGTSDWGANTQFVFSVGANSSTSGSVVGVSHLGGSFTPSSGTATYTNFIQNYTSNQIGTSSGNVKAIEINPTLTSVRGNHTGIDYNPAVTSITGTHYGVLIRPAACLNSFGAGATPTAMVHIGPGTTTRAQLKLDATTLVTSPAAGVVEFDGTNYYGTVGTTRYVIAKSLFASATLDFPDTAAQSYSDLTISVPGAAVNDQVSIGVPASSIPSSACSFWGFVSASDVVTIRFVNSGSASSDPTSGTFTVRVF